MKLIQHALLVLLCAAVITPFLLALLWLVALFMAPVLMILAVLAVIVPPLWVYCQLTGKDLVRFEYSKTEKPEAAAESGEA